MRCGYSNDQNSLDETTCCAAGVTECIFNVLNVLGGVKLRAGQNLEWIIANMLNIEVN